MVLPVGRPEASGPEQAVAASFDHPRRELEVAALAGGPEQLDERHLDLRVAVDRQAAARTKLAVDGVGGPDGDREEPVVPERALPGDGGLDQVADAIELVTPRQILVFVAGLHDLDVGVEIAVRALRRRHEVDRPVGIAGQGRVRSPPELPGGRLQPLVEVGVEEREDDADLLAEGAVATVGPCCQAEVRQISRRH